MKKVLAFFGFNSLSRLKKASKAYTKSTRSIQRHAPNAAAEIDEMINNLDVARSAALDVKSFVNDLHQVAKTTNASLEGLTQVKYPFVL